MPKAVTKKKAGPLDQAGQGKVVPPVYGSALWFCYAMARAAKVDPRAPVGQDLLAIGVRMSQADRVRLADVMTRHAE
jgi:hypothetical protein